MKTTYRLEQALQKLYTAFHNNTLNPECCKQCAVGNILDKTDSWKHFSDDHGSLELNYVGHVNETFGKRFNGYKPSELLLIEQTFLKGCGFQVPLNYQNRKPLDSPEKELLFRGLCEVIDCLCQLDNLPSVLDYSKFTHLLNTKRKGVILK